MLKKQFYEAPEAEILLVKFEENILSGEDDTTKPYMIENDNIFGN